MATIQIADNDARVQYTQAVVANTTQLTIDFPFFDLDDINVIVTSAAGVDTTLTRGTGSGTFAVTATSVDDGFSGGYITLGDSYADASTKYTIFRDIPVSRTTDFPTSGPFNISALNTELDKIFAVEQELETKIARTMRLSDSDTAADISLPKLDDRKGTVLAFNETTGLPEVGPEIADISTLQAINADIATLADIEDGTEATDTIQTVAGISSNVTTVAGIAANVTTVAGNTSNINAVVADATDIGTVATNIASVNTVAGNISEVIAVANDLNEAVSEVETVANDLNEAVSEIETVAASISNVDAVGTNIANVNTVAGIDSDVTSVAGNSTNINTVAGINGNVTTVAGVSGNVTTVAGISADVSTVAGDSADIQAVAADATDIGTVSSNIADVNTVAGSIANVNTTAANITGVNSFAERYRVGATDPTTSLDEGDLFFNTTDDAYKFYDGTAWRTVNVDGITSVLDDATPQLGGDLGTNGNDITFGDNDKAIFGDGNDLSIYHDGSNSYISDQGTGNLRILAEDFRVVNAANSETMIQANIDSVVKLYYDSSPKLSTTATGVDVTGSIEVGDGHTIGDDANDNLTLTSSTGENIKFDTAGGATLFLESGSEVARISSGRLGLGTTSPDTALHISASDSATLRIESTDTSLVANQVVGGIEWESNEGSVGSDGVVGKIDLIAEDATPEYAMRFFTHDTSGGVADFSERMRIDSVGKVGIGTTSPNVELDVRGEIEATADGGGAQLNNVFTNSGTAGNDNIVIRARIGGTTARSMIQFADADDTNVGQIDYDHEVDAMIFTVNASEAMRIPSAGGIDVTGNVTFGDNDKAIFGAGSDLEIYHDGSKSIISDVGTGNLQIRAGGEAMVLNADGSEYIARFNDNGDVKLYYDNALKLATTSTGVNVTGTVTATAFVGSVGLDDLGSFILARQTDTTIRSAGATRAGSGLQYSNADGDVSGSPTGTWRLHGRTRGDNPQERVSVWQRIS